MLIRLLLISRTALLPQTFEMYTPFNLFCLFDVVGWMPTKNWIVFPCTVAWHLSVFGLVVFVHLCVCLYVYNYLSVNICVIFRAKGPMRSAVEKMEIGQGRSACAHTAKASVLYLKTSIIACNTHANEDMA